MDFTPDPIDFDLPPLGFTPPAIDLDALPPFNLVPDFGHDLLDFDPFPANKKANT
ncbi:hypothetical protein [Vreelandella stevensii]|uniref:hypothetical protein n=1 Tax=Vreelandella stevensii TaxID=502821 RepID=UPI00403A940D